METRAFAGMFQKKQQTASKYPSFRGGPAGVQAPPVTATQVTKQWLEAFKRGEDWAFEQLYERFERPVRSFLSARVGDAELGRELGQEVFLKLHRFKDGLADSCQSIESLSGWIFAIARNTAHDWFRGVKAEREMTRPILEDEDFVAPELPDLAELRDRRGALKSWLRGLTSRQRRVVWLRLIHGLSYDEIARKIGVSAGAARCLFHRATEFVPA